MTDWAKLESKWQQRWRATEFVKVDHARNKKFITVAYPYPNSPQHIGHGRTYTLADVHARFERMHGNNVLFPMAFHYTGTPILGMAERIESGDADIINSIVDIYGVPRDVVATFADPVKIASYFHKEIKSGMIEMGYSIDWSGEFTTIDPAYQKFIEWQVRLLRDHKMIVQGSHPVGWCARDKNPVSQHDTLGDVEPAFVEYVIVRAELDDGRILPAATMRPETIYGVTNMWVNPDIDYYPVRVQDKTWLVSSECADKMDHLACGARRPDGGTPVRGSDLVGHNAKIPGIGRTVPVLLAGFVRGETGTGAVMSVPAHAPYDYQALEDLKKRNDGEPSTTVAGIAPIQIMSSGGSSGQCPAEKIVRESGIADQLDPRLDEITKKVYADEYRNSVMLDNAGVFAGMRASTAKTESAKWLAGIQTGRPQVMYEFSNAPVHCRCGEQCVVHILDNQWFLDYSNPEWKEIAKECLEGIEIVPSDMRPEFDYVFGWLRERACARQTGLGTRLPWDSEWTVESLSDSVIYMAYYVISRFVNAAKIKPESLGDRFFDYVFFGQGDAAGTASMCGMDSGTLDEIRDAFSYFYPVDSRHSGRDLVPNHLSFFIFNHAMIFPKEHWPRQIIVNGSVMMDGKKMSKSMSNTVPLRQAIHKYGADPIRLAILMSAELLQDAEFKFEHVRASSSKLESMMRECAHLSGSGRDGAESGIDLWLGARMREISSEVSDLIKKMRMREALGKILSDIDSALAWHAHRSPDAKNHGALRAAWSVRAALLSPFAPHVADEMWEMLGNDGAASSSAWPETLCAGDSVLLCSESLLESAIRDIQRILDLTKITPSQITLYVASSDKLVAYRAMLGAAQKGGADLSSIMRMLGESEQTAGIRRNADYVKRALVDILSTTSRDKKVRLDAAELDEATLYSSALAGLVRDKFGVGLTVYSESDPEIADPKNKAKAARPFKPAILIT